MRVRHLFLAPIAVFLFLAGVSVSAVAQQQVRVKIDGGPPDSRFDLPAQIWRPAAAKALITGRHAIDAHRDLLVGKATGIKNIIRFS